MRLFFDITNFISSFHNKLSEMVIHYLNVYYLFLIYYTQSKLSMYNGSGSQLFKKLGVSLLKLK